MTLPRNQTVLEQRLCLDCTTPFTVTEGEAAFFEAKQLSLPRRCPDCRRARRAERAISGATLDWDRP
ncbi:MAG: zinc-ribbon domain containing protein [Vicinamibacterales bacterium]